MAIWKDLDPITDIVVAKTALKTAMTSTLPATEARKGSHGGAIMYPPGYARGVGECSSSFFTLLSSSQILDISYGIRSGCFDDTGSMFYNTQKTWGTGKLGGFTTKGLEGFSTSSMIYSSSATFLNDAKAFQLDGDYIDLLGVLNFKRASYREELAPGTMNLGSRISASGQGVTMLKQHTFTESPTLDSTAVGSFSHLQGPDGTAVGGVYHDYGIVIFDILKLFFTSSVLREVHPDDITALSPGQATFMKFLTGSLTPGNAVADADNKVIHTIAFFSGSEGNSQEAKNDKYFNRRSFHSQSKNLLNFYSGSYSQSLNSLAMELGGVSAQSLVNFQSSIYFCRANKDQFNYSANPTFTTGAGENLTYRTDPLTTFITSIGLFNDREEMLAVGKLSQPLKKDYTSEMNLRVRLDF